MISYANDRNIKMLTSTPYYAQVNGQVEVANKIVIALIKKHIDRQSRNWHNILRQVLLAYRNSLKGSIGMTPYKLVYSHDVVLLIEINLQSVRGARQDELLVDDYCNSLFDELNELNEERLYAFEKII